MLRILEFFPSTQHLTFSSRDLIFGSFLEEGIASFRILHFLCLAFIQFLFKIFFFTHIFAPTSLFHFESYQYSIDFLLKDRL